MSRVSADHFGGNIVLTNDCALPGSPYRQMLNEISFHNFRYPGGGVTEDQTWENGGLRRMFGDPMDPSDPNYVMTLSEALHLSVEMKATMTIVIPTFQFFDKENHSFDHAGFRKYVAELEKALEEVPEARIGSLEIGNEFWAELTPEEYGFIANKEIPALRALAEDIAERGGEAPKLALQAGAQWRATSVDESREIAAEISISNRSAIGEIVQHAYPNAHRQLDWQKDWALDPMKVYERIKGFSDDLDYALTEFNIARTVGPGAVFGVNQAAIWIEEFSRYINAGIDAIDSWGVCYKWLTNKFYDPKFAPEESDGGRIRAKATPMGQIYDIAEDHLIGKRTMSDKEAVKDIGVPGGISVTGFSGSDQRVVFLSNRGSNAKEIDLSKLKGMHVSAHHLIAADSPASPWYDESTMVLSSEDQIIDARGDLNVKSGSALPSKMPLRPNELVVLVISEPSKSLTLEGAHNVTDPGNRMVNDILVGGSGNDRLLGYVGDDRLVGGRGNDRLRGGAGEDTLKGSSGTDRLWGMEGADHISGGPGNDTARGGAGNDRLWGGSGNDALFGNTGADRIRSGPGEDRIWGGDGNDSIVGGSGNDRLLGGLGDDRIWSGGGNDTLFGNSGADQLRARAGHDRIYGAGGNDRIVGGSGDDTARGGDGDDRLWGGSGNDALFGNTGADRIRGGSGVDRIWGGDGNDSIVGGSGNDRLLGGLGDDRIWSGGGNDTLSGNTGDDGLSGGAGDDRIWGGSGNDEIVGGSGNDRLWGGSGKDRIAAGGGQDHLWGEAGADEFVFASQQGYNVIHDFDVDQDTIVFTGSASSWDLVIEEVADGTELFYNGTVILLRDLFDGDFRPDSFIFT